MDTTLGREVAIKVLPDAVSADADRVLRFEREARVLAALNHANVATIHGMHAAPRARAHSSSRQAQSTSASER